MLDISRRWMQGRLGLTAKSCLAGGCQIIEDRTVLLLEHFNER